MGRWREREERERERESVQEGVGYTEMAQRGAADVHFLFLSQIF